MDQRRQRADRRLRQLPRQLAGADHDHVVPHAGHRARGQTPGLAQRGADVVVAEAEGPVLQDQQRRIVSRRGEQRAVARRGVAEQHGLAALLEQTRRVRDPGVQAQRPRQPAHQEAAQRRALPQRLELLRGREGGAQADRQGQRGDLARAQVGQRLAYRLNAASQSVEGGVGGPEHARGERHV